MLLHATLDSISICRSMSDQVNRDSRSRSSLHTAILAASTAALLGLGALFLRKLLYPQRVGLEDKRGSSESVTSATSKCSASSSESGAASEYQAATHQQPSPPSSFEVLPLGTPVSEVAEMLSKSATVAERLAQLALLASQGAHSALTPFA